MRRLEFAQWTKEADKKRRQKKDAKEGEKRVIDWQKRRALILDSMQSHKDRVWSVDSCLG